MTTPISPLPSPSALSPTTVAGPAAPQTAAPGGGGFGDALAGALEKLDGLQQQASTGAQQLATGQTSDVSSVAMQVEQASLALQLAVQVRNKAVDAYQELFRMQV